VKGSLAGKPPAGLFYGKQKKFGIKAGVVALDLWRGEL
jgi:hypothetical protein